MGRRLRGASLRAEKRSKLAAKEIVESSADQVETRDVASKKDDELFVIDTTAVLPSKKQLEKKEKKLNKRLKGKPSAKEQTQIEKLVQNHSSSELQKLVQTGKATARRAKLKGTLKPTFDLWGDEPALKEESNAAGRRKKSSKNNHTIGSAMAGTKPEDHVQITTRAAMPAPVAKDKVVTIEVAKGGQSYNPDRVEHTKALQDAVEVENNRQSAEKAKSAPLSTGMSAETRALLVGDSDSDASSDDEDEQASQEDNSRPMEKRQQKLTRAQRNKQKRVRAEQRELESRKRQKKLQRSVGEAKNITKLLKKEEQEQSKRRQEVEKLKEQAVRTKGANVYHRLSKENPIHAPSYPVALRSDLKHSGGSLRSIRPKGSLITDRMSSLADRDMVAKKQLKKRKRVEGKRRKMKVKVRGKGHAESRAGSILG